MSETVLEEAWPQARKEHLCEVCWGQIGVGDVYLRQRNVSDDGPYTFKSHALCWRVSIHLAREMELCTWDGEWPETDEVRERLTWWFSWPAVIKEEPHDG